MFTPIQKLIPGALKKIGISTEAKAALVCEKYRKLAPEIIHKDVLKHTAPKFFRRRVLTVTVENSSWAHVVNEKKQDLLSALQKSLGDPRSSGVKDIRTCIGAISLF